MNPPDMELVAAVLDRLYHVFGIEGNVSVVVDIQQQNGSTSAGEGWYWGDGNMLLIFCVVLSVLLTRSEINRLKRLIKRFQITIFRSKKTYRFWNTFQR